MSLLIAADDPPANALAANYHGELHPVAEADQPFFSIVVTVSGRGQAIARCLDSILAQDFGGYEVVIVEDVDDGVAAKAREEPLADRRFRRVVSEFSRGVGPARNLGVGDARAPWIIVLDGHDELMPGALARMHEVAAHTPDAIHALWFRCRLDDGDTTPQFVPITTEWGYREYLRFLEHTAHEARDMIRCVRRPCFDSVRFPDNRMQMTQYHLDFARRFRSRMDGDTLRLVHQRGRERPFDLDGDARDVDGADPLACAQRRQALLIDSAEGFDALIRHHGRALCRYAPTLFLDDLRRAALLAIEARQARRAQRYAFALPWRRPVSVRAWRTWVASLLLADRCDG